MNVLLEYLSNMLALCQHNVAAHYTQIMQLLVDLYKYIYLVADMVEISVGQTDSLKVRLVVSVVTFAFLKNLATDRTVISTRKIEKTNRDSEKLRTTETRLMKIHSVSVILLGT